MRAELEALELDVKKATEDLAAATQAVQNAEDAVQAVQVTESARAHRYYSSKQVKEQGYFSVGCSSLAVNKCLIDTT